MTRNLAEGALHQVRFRQPGVEVVAEHVLGEQIVEVELAGGDERREVADAPQRHAVVVGDEAERPGADAIEAARQQHAERLVRQPPLERVGDEVVAVAARERLDQHLVAPGNDRALALQLEPVGDGRRQPAPRVIVGQHGAHALGEMRRQRELAAVVAGDDGVARAGAGDERLVLAHAFEAQHLAGEHEGVAGAQLLDEVFVDLAHDARRRSSPCALRRRGGRRGAP